ncbi:lipase [Pseudoalteromonas aurantia]|uniref:VolA/Pla-1 family phospholipase n=1 Tax=Pseudoalteromonas aurantia TaxID=43654 RepID=UPI00110AF90B|nr:VolA/Pla-1 family phospholipase [Pseudoalteromonas aurantia]TMO65430.1 lipase [Pseudoalteromonas aurantia]
MKKMLLSLAVTSVLAGCGGGETLEDIKNETAPVLPSVSIKFDPSNGVISIPNDLLLSGTQDGTINLPGELDSENNPAISRAQYANPSLALGALDGWSSQMPYVIDLNMAAGMSVNGDSVKAPGSVRIFEVIMGASRTDEQCAQVPAGIACKSVAELSNGLTGDFIAQLTSTGDGIAIQPLKPFKAGSTYITVLTSGIEMADGRPIKASSTYTLARQDADLVTPAQLALQGAVRSYEAAVTEGSFDDALGALSKDNIIYSAAATIQSVGPVMAAAKGLLAASLATGTNPKLEVPEQPVITVRDVLVMGGQDPAAVASFQAIQYMKGSIQLPMYSGMPQAVGVESLADTYWQAACDNGLAVAGYKAAVGGTLPTPEPGTNDALCSALSGDALRDFNLDPMRHVTKFNSIPKQQWLANVPVQITKPIPELLGIEQPATGWPVVILQHGITTNKETMLGLTLALSAQGFATVAIDHPMHGERGIDVDNDGTDDFNATTGSILSYMNLTSLLVARDNLRQSTADLLGLRLGLNFGAPAIGLNPTDVSFVGHSLGAIVAPSFVAHTNLPLNEQVDGLFKVQSAALASGGSGIASFLIESEQFGSFVQGSVLSAAGNVASNAFLAFLQSDGVAGCAAEDIVPCGYSAYIKHLTETGDTASLAAINGIIQQFAVAAQSALDSADPLNYAELVKAVNTPVYMNVVTGGVDGNKPDTVIPPTTANPLSGSSPLARFMGLQTVSESQGPGNYVVNFSQGHHGSIITTAFSETAGGTAQGHAMATVEMQTQLVSYLKSKGLVLPITNPAVVAN